VILWQCLSVGFNIAFTCPVILRSRTLYIEEEAIFVVLRSPTPAMRSQWSTFCEFIVMSQRVLSGIFEDPHTPVHFLWSNREREPSLNGSISNDTLYKWHVIGHYYLPEPHCTKCILYRTCRPEAVVLSCGCAKASIGMAFEMKTYTMFNHCEVYVLPVRSEAGEPILWCHSQVSALPARSQRQLNPSCDVIVPSVRALKSIEGSGLNCKRGIQQGQWRHRSIEKGEGIDSP
jgi:hypothetical protein